MSTSAARNLYFDGISVDLPVTLSFVGDDTQQCVLNGKCKCIHIRHGNVEEGQAYKAKSFSYYVALYPILMIAQSAAQFTPSRRL